MLVLDAHMSEQICRWGILSAAEIARKNWHSVALSGNGEILAVASGKKTRSELNGFGDEEFLPWTVGPVL